SPRTNPERDATAVVATLSSGPELCVVVPTFNERDNVDILIQRLDQALRGIDWEVVFVDDDSPDGTARHVRALAERDRRTRCIRRIDRRGLSSACIEGMLSTSAPLVAVIDGDLQHDESLLPRMRDTLKQASGKQDPADVVIASRYVGSGSSEGLSDRRKRLSLFGARLARRLVTAEVADAVTGFFMLRRARLDEIAPRLLLIFADIGFTAAEAVATAVAMVSNFFLNNTLTYRDCRLVGWQAVRGLASFMALCGLGALTNVAVARDLYDLTGMWLLAGF